MSDMQDGMQQPLTKADFLEAIGAFRSEFRSEFRSDLRSGLEGQGKSLRDELRTGLESQSKSLRDEFRTGLESQSKSLRDEFRTEFQKIHVTLSHHSAELADVRGYLKDKLVTRDEFHSRMDGFAGRVDDYDYSAAKNRARLDEHEKRISALEAERS